MTGGAYKRILRKISDWSVKWKMSFDRNMCQILPVVSRNIKNDYVMLGDKIERVHTVKNLFMTIASEVQFS